MRDVQPAVLGDTRNCSQQRNRRDDVVDLSERGIHRIDVAPLRISRLHTPFELTRWRPTYNFIRQIDARALVEVKLLNHLHDAVNAHLQSQTVEVTVAGMSD